MKNSKSKKTKLPDDSFLNNRNSAVSPEFVPNPMEDDTIGTQRSIEEPFDIIPELKGKRFS